MVFPKEIVATWLHEIIPKIKDRYHGLTVTKFARLSDMNCSGYDHVGFDLIGSTSSEAVREQVALAKKYAERDGARGVIIAEFGVHLEDAAGEGVGEELQSEIIDRVFRESWGEVDGYFIVSWLLPGYSVKGRPAEQVIGQWFTASDGATPITTARPVATSTPAPLATPIPQPKAPPLGRPCSEFGDVTFTAPPMSVADIFYIRPMGSISTSHTIPTDHIYIHPNNLGAPTVPFGPERYPPPFQVMAPGDGYIVGIDTMAGHLRPAPDGQPILVEDYYIEIYHSCTVSSVYIHVNELAREIVEVTGEFGEGSRWTWRDTPDKATIPVKAGQVIGKVGGA